MNGPVIIEHNALSGNRTMSLRPHRNRCCPKLEVESLKSRQTRSSEDTLWRLPIVSELLTRSGCSLKWVYVNVELPAALPVKSPQLLSEGAVGALFTVSRRALGGFVCGWRHHAKLRLFRLASGDGHSTTQITVQVNVEVFPKLLVWSQKTDLKTFTNTFTDILMSLTFQLQTLISCLKVYFHTTLIIFRTELLNKIKPRVSLWNSKYLQGYVEVLLG